MEDEFDVPAARADASDCCIDGEITERESRDMIDLSVEKSEWTLIRAHVCRLYQPLLRKRRTFLCVYEEMAFNVLVVSSH